MVSRQPISRALGERRRTKFQTQDLQQNQQLPPPVAKLAHLNMPRTYAFSSDSLLRRKCIELRNTLLCNLLYHQLRIWPHHNPHLYLDSTWSIPWVPWCRPWGGAMREWVERGSNWFCVCFLTYRPTMIHRDISEMEHALVMCPCLSLRASAACTIRSIENWTWSLSNTTTVLTISSFPRKTFRAVT